MINTSEWSWSLSSAHVPELLFRLQKQQTLCTLPGHDKYGCVVHNVAPRQVEPPQNFPNSSVYRSSATFSHSMQSGEWWGRTDRLHCRLQMYVHRSHTLLRQKYRHRPFKAVLQAAEGRRRRRSRVHPRTQSQFSEIPSLLEHRAPFTAVEQTALDWGLVSPPPARA